ncbi:MAG: efflux RND transporter periplasmic adaptor subunit [Candidatus Thiodiazotropha sp. (ex Codakia rugifera)]|nr:efflux RND transporter periplasmic adaptor subunit [Candidatus Thiodiazotropha sp. (ex Lucinoma borealis)]MCU7930981.1 efflux RND transporter periplasmic adaptor subunit [Candidatus Thiodiazotropha sp. (ex Codakia rugifera)]
MLKKLFLAVVVVSLVIGGIVYTKLGQFTAMGEATENMVMPPETVTATVVSEDEWEQIVRATGSVRAAQGVTVSAEIGGRVAEISFESGAQISAGDVLLQMDTATEDAQLASALATAALARTELARIRKLIKRNVTSADELDQAEAQVKETAAQVGVIRAAIAKKTVRAPFAGHLGLRQVNLGEILKEGTAIVSLQNLDPVHVDFSLPQRELARLTTNMKVRVASDVAPGEIFEGKLIAVNPEVDPVTRNVRVRTLAANPGGQLRTGMFASVEVVLPQSRHVLSVPATSVLYAPFGNSVFVIDEQQDEQSGEKSKVLRQQLVQLGEARGDFIEITKGLKPGETVVTSGVFKLSAGTQVVIDNTLAPKASLDPQPSES